MSPKNTQSSSRFFCEGSILTVYQLSLVLNVFLYLLKIVAQLMHSDAMEGEEPGKGSSKFEQNQSFSPKKRSSLNSKAYWPFARSSVKSYLPNFLPQNLASNSILEVVSPPVSPVQGQKIKAKIER